MLRDHWVKGRDLGQANRRKVGRTPVDESNRHRIVVRIRYATRDGALSTIEQADLCDYLDRRASMRVWETTIEFTFAVAVTALAATGGAIEQPLNRLSEARLAKAIRAKQQN